MRKSSPSSSRATSLTFLGTGDAFASHGRFQSGYLIEADGHHILMEAGPTALCAMKRMGFSPADLDIILVSHLHGDHFGGLPFFILEYLWESPRTKPLKIAGPPELEKRTWRLFNTMFPFSSGDIERVKRSLEFTELHPGRKTRLGNVQIQTIRVPHMKLDQSLALRIGVGGKTIVFSGDTGWTDELVDFTAGADLFLCECTYFENQLGIHLNYPLLESKRETFDVKRIVLTHVGREVLDHEAELKMEVASDGLKIEV
ncbi:MAG TPA: MBL fold metallo-hydrolase [Candidatus Binataceae bacterium]|nr:MBL fold metallo-hydrolase [Candidatus Binataceae bacterium]